MSRQMLAQMVGALDEEIRAVRSRRGRTELTLIGGRRCGQSGQLYLYAFRLEQERPFREDSPVKVLVGDHQVEGVLVSWQDHVLVVGVDTDLGEGVAQVRLIMDDAFLLERLRERLGDVLRNRATDFNEPKASQTVGTARVRSADGPVPSAALASERPLNGAQLQAVTRAFGSDVTYIWGPPGTGKTTALAHVIDACYLAGQRVLVVSNTNIAVDTLLEKFVDWLASRDDARLVSGAVLRVGPVVKPELAERYGEQVDLDKLADRLAAGLHAEREHLRSQLEHLSDDEARLRAAVAAYGQLDRLQRLVNANTARLHAMRERWGLLQTAVSDAAQRISDLEVEIERAGSTNPVVRWVRGIKPEQLRAELSVLRSQRSRSIVALDQLRGEVPRLDEELRGQSSALTGLRASVAGLPPNQECAAELNRARASQAKVQQRLKQVDEELGRIRDRLIRGCSVLATSVYQAYLRPEIAGAFDVVVVDEASMLMPPLVYYAAGRARSRVVVAGDFRQLPPIVMSKQPEVAKWLKTDVFSVAGIKDAVEGGAHPESLVALSEQYRMRRGICRMVSSRFYEPENALVTHGSVRERSAYPLLGPGPLCYVDTSRWHPWACYEANSGSCYNITHALIATELLAALARIIHEVEGRKIGETRKCLVG